MIIIDLPETKAWLAKKSIIDSAGKISMTGFVEPVSSRIPADSGKKSALSKMIKSLFLSEEEALLWINEFGMWPSCEVLTLFDGFRRSLSESAPLFEKPGHIFSKNDLDAFEALTAMVLYFCWGALLVPGAADFLIKISHDEMISIFARDKEILSNVREKLPGFLTG